MKRSKFKIRFCVLLALPLLASCSSTTYVVRRPSPKPTVRTVRVVTPPPVRPVVIVKTPE